MSSSLLFVLAAVEEGGGGGGGGVGRGLGRGGLEMVVCSVMAVMDMTPELLELWWVLILVFLLLMLLLLPVWSFDVVGVPVSNPSMKDSETPSLKTVDNRGSPKTQLLQS